MRKFYLFMLALLSAVGAWAQYTWNGGSNITSVNWNQSSSWTTSASITDKGPGTPNSNLWNVINISNATGTTPTLEGWTLRMVLDDVTLNSSNTKMQNGDGVVCSFTLKNTSTLDLTQGNGQHTNDFNVDLGTGNGNIMIHRLPKNYGGVVTVNYGTISADMNRQFKVSSTDANNRTVGGLTVVATMPEAASTNVATLHVVTLATMTHASFTNKTYNITEGKFTRVEGPLTAENRNIAKYSIVEEGNEIKLYWVTGPCVELTYNFNIGGVTKATKIVYSPTGEAYPNVSPSVITTFRCSPDYYTVTGLPTGTVAGDQIIDLTVTQHLPFKISSDFNNATWYTMNIHGGGYYLNYEENATEIGLGRQTTTYENKDMFCFVGNIFDGFKIYNKAAGDGKLLSSVKSTSDDGSTKVSMVDKTTAETQGYLWDVTKSTNRGANGFYLGLHDYNNGKNRLNRRDYKINETTYYRLSYWTGGADGGSTIKISSVDDMFTLMQNAEKISILEGSTVQQPSEFQNTPADINAAIEAAKNVANTYDAKKEFVLGPNGTIIKRYLDALNAYGSLANIQFEMKSQYATLIMPCPSSSVDGLKSYTCSAIDANNVITLTPNGNGGGGAFAYNVPYIIEATPGAKFTIVGWDKGSRGTHTSGLLTGVLTEGGVNIPRDSYVLAKNGEKVGFFKVTGDAVKCPQYKCYLTPDAGENENSARVIYFSSDDVETGINVVETEETTPANAVIYDLSGRRVQGAKSGLYIVNGKKVIK